MTDKKKTQTQRRQLPLAPFRSLQQVRSLLVMMRQFNVEHLSIGELTIDMAHSESGNGIKTHADKKWSPVDNFGDKRKNKPKEPEEKPSLEDINKALSSKQTLSEMIDQDPDFERFNLGILPLK